MAVAVAALDGTNAGNATTATLGTATGVIGESVFSDIADAIRGRNGLETTYKPGEMAQVIRDLVCDVGLKPRALLLSDETLELNYLDGRQVKSGSATVKAAWEVSTEGYASPSDRPWHRVRGEILQVWVDESFATVVTELGLMNFDYFFNSMSAMTEVVGFQHLSGMTTAKQCFVSCTDPESVYATSFDMSALTAGCQMFYGCQKPVGGTDGTVAGNSTAYSICKLGEGGVLTDPRQRHEAVVLGGRSTRTGTWRSRRARTSRGRAGGPAPRPSISWPQCCRGRTRRTASPRSRRRPTWRRRGSQNLT